MADKFYPLIDWLSQNKEWFFSGIGVFVIVALFQLMRRFGKTPSQVEKQTKTQPSPQMAQSDCPQLSSEEILKSEEEKKSHIVEYIINFPLDTQLNDKELMILERFVDFPRGQHTQGYRLDWIYDELLADIPSGVSYMILENLLEKGHLEKWVTKRGSVYYRVSDGGRRFLVDNELLTDSKKSKKRRQFTQVL